MTPQAQEAFTVAEANWYETNGIEPDPDTDAWAHKLAQDMWAKALQWAAQLDTHEAALRIQQEWDVHFTKPMDSGSRGLDYQMANHAAKVVADLLHNDTPSPEGKP